MTDAITYDGIWLAIDTSKPLIAQLAAITSQLQSLTDAEQKEQSAEFLGFIENVQESIGRLKTCGPAHVNQKEVIQLLHRNIGIEAFIVAKALVEDAKMKWNYGSVEECTFVVYLPSDQGDMSIICDGCRVRHPHPHNCMRDRARVSDEPVHKPCECNECRETHMFQALGFFSDTHVWTKIRVFDALPK